MTKTMTISNPSDLLATLFLDSVVNSGPRCCVVETVLFRNQEAQVQSQLIFLFLCDFAKATSFSRVREEWI